jgi:hypothetical protein
VYFELNKLAIVHEKHTGRRDAEITVVHGNASRGVDYFADQWAVLYGVPERHDAIWRSAGIFDKLAGFSRNQKMVDLGADVCVAFLMQCTKKTCRKASFHYTHGTWDCVTRARKADIPVIECYHPGTRQSTGK